MGERVSQDTARRVFRIEAQAIQELLARLDASFDRAVDLLFKCQGRVVVTGMGKSGLIGRKIAATFASTGTPSLFLHPAEAVHGDLGMLVRDDALLAISYGGDTEEIVLLLETIKRLGIPLVTMTGNPRSTIAQSSDVVLDISVKEEACSLNLAPTASTTAALAMGDALAIALLDKRGLKEEDFAQFHPGGTLGRRLLLKVRDLMHQGEAIPRVDQRASARDAIKEMTSKKLGMTTVVDAQGRLQGVVTDGDLRRCLEKGVDVATARAGDLASTNPKSIGPDDLAARAVQIMEQFSITSLVVLGEQGQTVGVIHMHDLLKSGVV